MMCLNKNRPSAKVSDNRLVLSLPNAETPVVWILSMADAVTCVLRLETDRQGFFVIKKHGGQTKGATGETVAVYRNRDDAMQALNCASNGLNNARDGKSGSAFKRWFTRFTYAWFIISMLLLFRVDAMILRATMDPPEGYVGHTPAAQTGQQPQQQPAKQSAVPMVSPDLDATGVPLSADEFLQHQSTKIRIP